MERDLELLRQIMLAVESSPTAFAPREIKIPGRSEEEVGYHQLLLIESGLAKGVETTAFGDSSPSGRIVRLTSAGHDFIAGARDDGVWRGALSRIASVGGTVTLAVLTQLLGDQLKKSLGLG